MSQTEVTTCDNCRQLLHSMKLACGKREVQRGIGAVLILIGVTLCITGAIFTVVAFSGKKKNVVPSFPYSGPVLICLSVACFVNGYILSNIDSMAKAWLLFKQRKEYPYMDQETKYSIKVQGNDCISIVCLWVLFKCFAWRYNQQTTQSLTSTLAVNESSKRENSISSDTMNKEAMGNTGIEQQTGNEEQPSVKHTQTDNSSRRNSSKSFVSFSSLRQLKIHPEIPGDSNICDNIEGRDSTS